MDSNFLDFDELSTLLRSDDPTTVVIVWKLIYSAYSPNQCLMSDLLTLIINSSDLEVVQVARKAFAERCDGRWSADLPRMMLGQTEASELFISSIDEDVLVKLIRLICSSEAVLGGAEVVSKFAVFVNRLYNALPTKQKEWFLALKSKAVSSSTGPLNQLHAEGLSSRDSLLHVVSTSATHVDLVDDSAFFTEHVNYGGAYSMMISNQTIGKITSMTTRKDSRICN